MGAILEKNISSSSLMQFNYKISSFSSRPFASFVIPEEVNEETGPVLNEQIGAAQNAYDALSEEELAREDVQVVTVTPENRDALIDLLRAWL